MKHWLAGLALASFLVVPGPAAAEGNEAEATVEDGVLVIRVDGSGCDACVLGSTPVLMKISRTLKGVEAVDSTSIDRSRSTVRVAYDPERISPEQIGDVLVNHGHRVTEHITITGEAVTITMR